MTAMTQRIIEEIGACPRGQVFLINVQYSIEHGLDQDRFMEVLEAFGIELSMCHAMPAPDKLVEQLGQRCASANLWLHADEPRLHFFYETEVRILSRMTTYSRFFSWIMARRNGAPALADVPDPLPIGADSPAEVLDRDVARVRQYIDANAWRPGCIPDVKFDALCNWMAPYDELARRMADGASAGDRYRDVVGLSHFKAGDHVIRIDIDLDKWRTVEQFVRRRPNCGANGGNRFLMPYDKPPGCRWGRTVDLEVLAQRRMDSLNGVPELVMEPFSIPNEAMSTRYIGVVTEPPEDDDAYFLSRVAHFARFSHP